MPSVFHSCFSSGGWNRTNGLLVQSQASLPTATTPDRSLTRTFRARQGSGRRVRTFVSWFKAKRPTTSRSPITAKPKAESGRNGRSALGFRLSAFRFGKAPVGGIEPPIIGLTGRRLTVRPHRIISVRTAGFEPAISCSRGTRNGQAFLRPESQERPAGVEPALPPRQGGRLPLHHGRIQIVKDL